MTHCARFLLRTICCLLLTLTARSQDLVGIYLEWVQDPATTMIVNWVDLYPEGTTELYWRQEGVADWKQAKAARRGIPPSGLHRCSLELTELQPDTRYEISIGNIPEKNAKPLFFRTMPRDLKARPVRFLNGGDTMATREMFEAMNRQAALLEPDFVVLGGDLAYENGIWAMRVVEWLQSWTRTAVTKDGRLLPLVAGIGNHEVRGHYNGRAPGDAPYYYGLFTLPDGRASRTLDFGRYLSLVLLDSAHTEPIQGAQTQWLERALLERTEQQFLFPFYHSPAWGTTKAPKQGTPLDNPVAIAIRSHWVPLFERFGISAAFEHDHHNFKRTHRILDGKRDDERGLLYLGDGAWGVLVRTVPAEGSAWWLAKAEARNHLWCIDLRGDGVAAIRAFDSRGIVFDTVELDRARTKPAAPAR
ncbi:MAG: fibronectin type III domain-containing protein [Planctomycetia bacterium]